MSDNQSWNSTGEQIKDALSEALRSGDFKNLNDLVSQTVTSTLNEVGRHIIPGSGEISEEQESQIKQRQERLRQKREQLRHSQEQMRRRESQINQQKNLLKQQEAQLRQQQEQMRRRQELMARENAPSVKLKKVGNVSSVLYQVFGGIGLGVTGILTFLHLIFLLAGIGASAGSWIVNFIFIFIFFGMIHLGIRQRMRLKRAERYVQLCGRNMYGEIESIAKSMGKKVRYVVKDLQKMLKLGIFPEGHLDEKKTCFMLNDSTYQQYVEAENSRILREKESRMLSQSEARPPETENPPEMTGASEAELNTMIAEGMECISKLKDLNDKIPGEIISGKLSRLENLLKDIFDSVREHPEQMHRMHKLMDYYLPTTLKLVEAYEEFDRVNSPGEEIASAKAEIENTLDTINQAFTELLNNLFQDAVFDATTDAQVLKTMLAREGLTNDMDITNADTL
ncbi:MAG: 5-bromo-4-chloroindolyl phosphate hydrolysis family protein [Lachnospiraceae bacterium]|nr:5-bromo-4-chloroindolyl phosphate hydrolysis family protein [Lachnospiraceae bacterium]